jgi:polynucleotide 5'-kinase involved in rRNA processing
VSADARARSQEERAERRRARFRSYFEGANVLGGSWPGVAVYGSELVRRGRLVALQDARGLTLAVGSVAACEGNDLQILTPFRTAARVASLRIGSLRLDPETGEELP